MRVTLEAYLLNYYPYLSQLNLDILPKRIIQYFRLD